MRRMSAVVQSVIMLKMDLVSVGLALFLGLVFVVLFEIFRIKSVRSGAPPGPRALPFVGNAAQMNQMKFVRSMSQYGEVSSLFIGRKMMISLNSIQVAREALVQETFSGRPVLPLVHWVTKGLGIVMATFGHSWRQQRRFALHTLRNFGLGKKSAEDRVREEAQYLVAELLKDEGHPFDPQHDIQNAVSNIICSTVFGNRFNYEDKRFACLLKILNENLMITGSPSGQIFNLAPFLKHFPGAHQTVMRNAIEVLGFIRDEVREHRETLDPDSPRDFLDAYLLEIEKQKTQADSTFHEENMLFSTADLFLAGTDTTASTIRWGLIFLMDNPDVQERCHEEIVQLLGYDRLPSMSDRDNLPYTFATIHEIQRCGNIVPFGVIHETIRPSRLQGYHIPQGTTVVTNLTAIFSDKRHWKHPDTFNPGNFLDEDGRFYRPDSFIPFSLGPRVCLGETLARTELFLFLTSLLQRIVFSWPPDAPALDMDGIMGIVRFPHPFKVQCRSRGATDALTVR